MMSPDQARVVDPILSDHARGYSNPEFIGGGLFPTVDMPTRAAKRIEFGRESFKRYVTQRAPGSNINAISFGYEGKSVSLTQHALSAITPVEHQQEAGQVPGIDLQRENVDTVLAVIATEKEILQAQTARDATKYAASNKVALAGTDKFSDPNSDPLVIVSDFKEVVRRRTGRRPTTIAVGGALATVLKRHPRLREHYKHTTAASITDEMLRAYFDVANFLIGDAIYDNADGSTVDVWGGDLVLAYVPPKGMRSMRLPSYGYTYQLRSHPFVEPAHWERGLRSWVNDVVDEYSAELVGADAGVLIQNAL